MSETKIKIKKFNLRDKFGDWWENSTRPQRVAFRVFVITLLYVLPFLDNPVFGTTESDFASFCSIQWECMRLWPLV